MLGPRSCGGPTAPHPPFSPTRPRGTRPGRTGRRQHVAPGFCGGKGRRAGAPRGSWRICFPWRGVVPHTSQLRRRGKSWFDACRGARDRSRSSGWVEDRDQTRPLSAHLSPTPSGRRVPTRGPSSSTPILDPEMIPGRRPPNYSGAWREMANVSAKSCSRDPYLSLVNKGKMSVL